MKRAKRVVYTAGLMVAGGAMATPAATAAQRPQVDNVLTGTWHLHTNDCPFGTCSFTLHLIQNGHTITSTSPTSSSFISGSIHAPHIRVNFNGVSPEDNWTCAGKINAAKTIFHGAFSDGTGGVGTCRAVRTGP